MGGVGGTTVTSGRNPSSDAALELYKLEYERAAIRYEDIYKAMWQNFSYLAAVTGGILAFGGERFQDNLFWSLTCLPLVFWFWGTYMPLDRYGKNCGKRLKAIEEMLNKKYGTNLDHYRGFERRRSEKRWARIFKVRVVYIAAPLFLVLTGFFFWNLFQFIRTGTPALREKTAEVKIVTVSSEELRTLLEKAASQDRAPTGEEAKTKEN